MNGISCEVIQDLIKGCADGTASRATVKMVLEHIKMCDECRTKYEALRSGKKARVRKWFFVLHEPMETPVRYLRWSGVSGRLGGKLGSYGGLCGRFHCAGGHGLRIRRAQA